MNLKLAVLTSLTAVIIAFIIGGYQEQFTELQVNIFNATCVIGGILLCFWVVLEGCGYLHFREKQFDKFKQEQKKYLGRSN